MADKENTASFTRPDSKSRSSSSAAAVAAPRCQPKRRRVPLVELPSDPTATPLFTPPSPAQRRPRLRARKVPTRTARPLNADDAANDLQLCKHYAPDIHSYLRSMEAEPRRRPAADYIETVQNDVTAHMRGILVDWLVEVAEEYSLMSDTLYLTISYIDRFLSSNSLSRQKLQLLGVSCMLIASKYEEISPPHVEDFCYITDNSYTKQEVVQMESNILKLLKFETGNPTIKTFLRRFTRMGKEHVKDQDLQMEFLCNYLAELSLLDYGCVRFLPSMVAASAVFVARLTMDPNTHPWSCALQKQTGYSPSELKDSINAIHDLQLARRGSSFTAIREKYKQHRFMCVPILLPTMEIPSSYFEDFNQ